MPGTLGQQCALLFISIYLVLTRHIRDDPFMNWWLDGYFKVSTFLILIYVTMGIHVMMIVVNVCTEYLKIKSMNSISMAVGMVGNLVWVIIASNLWWQFPNEFFKRFWSYDSYTYELPDGRIVNITTAMSLEMWCMIEIMNVAGLVLTNILFMMLRSCVRHKLTFDNQDGKTVLPNTETVAALRPLINAFNSVWIPVLIIYFVQDHWYGWFTTTVKVTTLLNALSATFVMFVHWQKGPAWYRKFSPYLFFGILMFVYVLSPISMLLFCAGILIKMPNKQWYSGIYFMYFLFVYAFRLGEYFSKVRPLVQEARETLRINAEIENLSPDAL